VPFATPDRPVVPIPAADPLFVDVLRCALRAYELGDYARAARYFADAAALGGYRPESSVWAKLSASIEARLEAADLVSRDASVADVVRCT